MRNLVLMLGAWCCLVPAGAWAQADAYRGELQLDALGIWQTVSGSPPTTNAELVPRLSAWYFAQPLEDDPEHPYRIEATHYQSARGESR